MSSQPYRKYELNSALLPERSLKKKAAWAAPIKLHPSRPTTGMDGNGGDPGEDKATILKFEDLPQLDALIKEYLLWRGFTQCFRTFESARLNDRLRFFNVQRIVDQLFSFVEQFDFASMQSLWNFLSARFFVHLDGHHQPTVRAFARALQRYYIVHCVSSGSLQRVVDFLRTFGSELSRTSSSNGGDWEEWFQLPFLRNPAQDPRFAPFFTTQWRDTLRTSLSNFLSLIFRNIPVPRLLAFNLQQIQLNKQESALQAKMARIEQLESELSQSKERIAQLDHENISLRHALWRSGSKSRDHRTISTEGDTSSNTPPDVERHQQDISHDSQVPRSTGKDEESASGSDDPNLTKPHQVSSKESLSPESDQEAKRLLRGATSVEIFDGTQMESQMQNRRSTRGSYASVVEQLFGSDDENSVGFGDSIVGQLETSEGSPEAGIRTTKNSTTTRQDSSLSRKSQKSDNDYGHTEFDGQVALHIDSSVPVLGHSSSVLCAKFNQSGSMFASGSLDATLRIWDVSVAEAVSNASYNGNFGNTRANMSCSAACASTVYCMSQVNCLDWVKLRGNDHVMFGTSCRDVKLWDVKGRCFSLEFQSRPDMPIVTSIQHAPQASHLVSIHSQSTQNVSVDSQIMPASLIQLWDMEHNRLLRDIHSAMSPAACTRSQCISPNGSVLYAGGDDGKIHVYDLKQPKAEVLKWQAHDSTGVANLTLRNAVRSEETAVRQDLLISIGRDGDIFEWDLRNLSPPKINRRYKGSPEIHHQSVFGIDSVFDPTGNFLLTSSNSNEALLFKVMRKLPVQSLNGHSGPVVAVDWTMHHHKFEESRVSSKNRATVGTSLILTGSLDGTLRLHNVTS